MRPTAIDLLMFTGMILIGAIIYGQCNKEENYGAFTVYPNHNEEFTIKCSSRCMEVWWGRDYIFNSRDTDVVITFVLGNFKSGIGGMITQPGCVHFDTDSAKLAGHIKDVIRGGECGNNVNL